MQSEEFHPDLSGRAPVFAPLRHIGSDHLSSDTAQTSGMTRQAAISAGTVGSEQLWMGQTRVPTHTHSANHHHGSAETAIYVVSGHPEFVFLDAETGVETRLRPKVGDFVYVPPFTPHREENNDGEAEAVVVIARSTQEAIVVNLDSLDQQKAPRSLDGPDAPHSREAPDPLSSP